MITAVVYLAMKLKLGNDWSGWVLVLPVLLDLGMFNAPPM